MKFTDGKGLLEIHIYDIRNKSDVERTEAFYSDAPRPDNDEAHQVSDVRTYLNRALDMLHGEGDFKEPPEMDTIIDYSIFNVSTGEIIESGHEWASDCGAEYCHVCGQLITEYNNCYWLDYVSVMCIDCWRLWHDIDATD